MSSSFEELPSAVRAARTSEPVASDVVAAEHRAGSGTPLLLLHGVTASFRIWEPVLPLLESHHDVIAPTLAGHHGAEALGPGLEPTVAALADRLEARLDELGIERLHVAGNSLGGWLSLELARRGRARSVTAFSPAAAAKNRLALRRVIFLVGAGHKLAVKHRERLRPLLERPGWRKALFRVAFAHPEKITAEVVAAMLEENAECSVLDEFLRIVGRDGLLAGTVDPPDCPIRIAWPHKDRTIPFGRYGAPLMERLPSAELVRLAGVGHVPTYDDPQLVANTITEVTARIDAARTASA